MNVNENVSRYIALRAEKAAIDAEAKAKKSAIDVEMINIEAVLQKHMHDTEITSLKTTAGTVYTTSVDSATVEDWTAVLDFIKSKNRFDLLERRVSKATVREYIEATNVTPPGIKYTQRSKVNFRKGTSL